MCTIAWAPVETTLLYHSVAATFGLGFVLVSYPGRSSTYRTAPGPQVACAVIGILALGYLGPATWRWSTKALEAWNADLPAGRAIGFSCGSVVNGADWLFPMILANASVLTLVALRWMPPSNPGASRWLKRATALVLFATVLSVQSLTVPDLIRRYDSPVIHLNTSSDF